MKPKKNIVLAIIILVVIGGAWYMKREKDLAKLHDIQTDLANYLYNNYRLYTVDKDKDDKLNAEYNKGEGNLTTEEFLKKSDELKEYSDIQKIKFKGFSVGPMNSLEVKLIINDVYTLEASSNTISAESGKYIFDFNTGESQNEYFLEESEESRTNKLPEQNIIYDNKGVK
ncbi:hypothetical protein [Enterococcus sp. AZ126]|uniref:hypothetical protein n=1 Tax=Enterococcus sp. AZ126 TaxID=2774635 RepID=UPI003F28F087